MRKTIFFPTNSFRGWFFHIGSCKRKNVLFYLSSVTLEYTGSTKIFLKRQKKAINYWNIPIKELFSRLRKQRSEKYKGDFLKKAET
jgi:hypothetical protein